MHPRLFNGFYPFHGLNGDCLVLGDLVRGFGKVFALSFLNTWSSGDRCFKEEWHAVSSWKPEFKESCEDNLVSLIFKLWYSNIDFHFKGVLPDQDSKVLNTKQ